MLSIPLLSLALQALVVSATPISPRDSTTSIGQFWAYGGSLNGIPLIYADGSAYIGNSAPSNASSAANVTLSQDGSGVTSAAPVNSSSSLSPAYLSVDTTPGAFEPVQFTSSTSNSSLTSSNFLTFGGLLAWLNNDNLLETGWWAQQVEDGVYALKWNGDNTDLSRPGFSVVLKNLAPDTSS